MIIILVLVAYGAGVLYGYGHPFIAIPVMVVVGVISLQVEGKIKKAVALLVSVIKEDSKKQ